MPQNSSKAEQDVDTALIELPVSQPPINPIANVQNFPIDPHGDVVLALETTTQGRRDIFRFQVNSAILSLASPVFRAMLMGDSSSSRKNTNLNAIPKSNDEDDTANTGAGSPRIREILLDNDNPDALAIALRIIHFSKEGIPTRQNSNIDPFRLYQLAIICNKYDMRNGLSNWIKQWNIPEEECFQTDGDEEVSITIATELGSRWLFIAYAFGHENLFEKVSSELIYLSCEDHDSCLLGLPDEMHPAAKFLGDVPGRIIAEIENRREAATGSIEKLIRELIKDYSGSKDVLCHFKQSSCDATILGLLLQALHKINYNVYSTNPGFAHSVESLEYNLLNKITLPGFLPGAGYYTPSSKDSIFQGVDCCPKPKWPAKTIGINNFLSQKVQCANCRQRYKIENPNHTNTCSPLPKFKKEVRAVIANIFGLKYSEFMPNRCRDKKGSGEEENAGIIDPWASITGIKASIGAFAEPK